MIGIERDILILISRVRCMTETQVGKVFGSRKRYGRKPFKKTLRKMCNEYTLRKYPCNINYSGYKDNTYVYYLNGSKMYKGQELVKAVIGSEVAIKLSSAGYEIKRFYRNVSVADSKFDLFVEYIDKYNEPKQLLVDINLDDNFRSSKYEDMEYKINKSTIPFYEIPKILVVTSENIDGLHEIRGKYEVNFLDLNLSKLFRYI
ncbi:hypothetical protein [Romboutsia lituseburensis]|uniref:Replication-relaxation n=1 Tax=Romboutsia lituseburensis DSM 797 TaxID=1121325 RepID=A0A1G9K5S9_9FIRM|nr:hypothetical protein [Romboutsia lituseburensis]CEH34774.1 Hypothetical protein RLITU_2191 [Romboutsia lituseburensis]SDL44992.1 hypothetical protein SAMN04515677_10213 [Romboutsia lituseburensis DSM 797]